jgi:hypothetical protein
VKTLPAFYVLVLIAALQADCRRNIKMQTTDLKFAISIDKNEYNEGEAIRCKMTLTNTSGQSLYVNKRFLVNYPDLQHDVYFQIVDTNGQNAPFGLLVNAGRPDREHFEELDPQGSVGKEIDLARDFKIDPGSYTVKAVYESSSTPSALNASKIWRGKLESNSLQITVR